MVDVNDTVLALAVGNSAQYTDFKGKLDSVFGSGSITGSIAINISGGLTNSILETNDLSRVYYPTHYVDNNVGAGLSGTSFSIVDQFNLNESLKVVASGIASTVNLHLRSVVR